MCFDCKIVLHVPLKAYINNKLVDIPAKKFINKLITDICRLDSQLSCYVTNVKSVYKDRKYPEKLITIFTTGKDNNSVTADIVILFRKKFAENNKTLHQEAIAYEVNNELFVEAIAENE